MKTQAKQNSQIELKLSLTQKETIEEAARIKGLDLSEYIRSVLMSHSLSVVEAYRDTRLSDRDRDLFLTLLDMNTLPNQALQEAFAWYQTKVEP